MQPTFHASGFLYSLKTHQILLIQSKQQEDKSPLWSTLGGDGLEGENAQATFARIVSESLHLNLKDKDIYSVYDYTHESLQKVNFVFYAEVQNSEEFDSSKGDTFSWVAFSETSKLPFAPHSKQDVIVGERVINAKWRDTELKAVIDSLQ